MKSSKSNNLYRLVSFILIAVILLCSVGFAAANGEKNPDSGKDDDKVNNTDENNDGTVNDKVPDDNQNNNNNNNPEVPPDPKPVYTNPITGLEVSEEESNNTPLGFTLNPQNPLYGVSGSDLTIEFPKEDGKTIMLSYTTKTLLWKIGSLTSTRAFISNMSNYFGGVIISYGKDDIVSYPIWEVDKIQLDISQYSECYYKENSLYIYTSRDMVMNALKQNSDIHISGYKQTPYDFVSEGNSVSGTSDANSVIISYSDVDQTELYYSEKTNKYLYFKSGNRKIDMLSGENIAFSNVFVLFANTTTYEMSNGSELVVDTESGGLGYYISNGKMTEIKWLKDENNNLLFTDLSGEKLLINRGNIYISYFKASCVNKVKVL